LPKRRVFKGWEIQIIWVINMPVPVARKRMDAKQSRRMAGTFGVPVRRLRAIERLCSKHGKSVGEIPAWLLKKDPKRIEYWLRTGK